MATAEVQCVQTATAGQLDARCPTFWVFSFLWGGLEDWDFTIIFMTLDIAPHDDISAHPALLGTRACEVTAANSTQHPGSQSIDLRSQGLRAKSLEPSTHTHTHTILYL